MSFFCCIGRPKCGAPAPDFFVVLCGDEGATPVCVEHAGEYARVGFSIHRWHEEIDGRDLADVVFG